MASREREYAELRGLLSQLGSHFLGSDLGESSECLSKAKLREVAVSGTMAGLRDSISHLAECARCSFLLRAYRAEMIRRTVPFQWTVELTQGPNQSSLGLPEASDAHAFPYRALGYIDLSSSRFHFCDGRDQWIAMPMNVRVNIVVDPIVRKFAIVVLDAPESFVGCSFDYGMGPRELERDGKSGAFELRMDLEAEAYDGVRAVLNGGYGTLVFSVFDELGVAELLQRHRAIEREADYVLPSGFHSDTHINVGKLCHEEQAMQQIASAFEKVFDSVEFDTIVTNGWAMATIARRIAHRQQQRDSESEVREIMFTEYEDPKPIEDLQKGCRALILVDVQVTGALLEKLAAIVERAGGVVVGKGALVQAFSKEIACTPFVPSLASVQMKLYRHEECVRCDLLTVGRFNSLSNRVIVQSGKATSPSFFLDEHPEAVGFWNLIEAADAYEHHRVERGIVHYRAFVDTKRLLSHEEVGAEVMDRMHGELRRAEVSPDAIIVPNRSRSKLLASKLRGALTCGRSNNIALIAAKRLGHQWVLSKKAQGFIRGRNVLLVDCAIGHGKTLDQLAMIASRCGARSVCGAVILSRLFEDCEEALKRRWHAGFIRLFHFPVQPVIIRGHDSTLCPVCQEREEVKRAADELTSSSAREAVAGLAKRYDKRAPRQKRPMRHEQQVLFLKEPHEFLTKCSPKVASGITLHALYSSMNNSMAPLILPELGCSSIPVRNRAAMLEHLPKGVLEWDRDVLMHDLEKCLKSEANRTIWTATAGFLAREGKVDWLERLEGLLSRSEQLQTELSPQFWQRVCGHLSFTLRDAPSQRDQCARIVDSLIPQSPSGVVEARLQQVRECLQV